MVGNSLGGWITIHYAIKYPKNINRLILRASAGIVPIKTFTLFWIVFTSEFWKKGFHKINEKVYGDLEIENNALEFASIILQYYQPRTDVLPIFKEKELQNISVPFLYIGGEKDWFYNSEKAKLRLFVKLSNFRGMILKNTGHVVINQ